MPWAWGNIDWTATSTVAAAWVQAVGAVWAIRRSGMLAERSAKAARDLARDNFRQQIEHDQLVREAEDGRARARALHLAEIGLVGLQRVQTLLASDQQLGLAAARHAQLILKEGSRTIASFSSLALTEREEVGAYNAIGGMLAAAADAVGFFIQAPNGLTSTDARRAAASMLAELLAQSATEFRRLKGEIV